MFGIVNSQSIIVSPPEYWCVDVRERNACIKEIFEFFDFDEALPAWGEKGFRPIRADVIEVWSVACR